MRLKDKVALITGGAAGIGKASALRFSEEGAQVAIGDVDSKRGSTTLNELGSNAAFNHVDVTDRSSVDSWVESVLGKYGRIDILVNNAGIVRDSLLVKIKDGEHHKISFLKMNPAGKIPVIDDDGFTLFESGATDDEALDGSAAVFL